VQTVDSALQTIHFAVQTVHFAVQSLHFPAQTFHLSVQSLHFSVQSLHFAAQSLHTGVQTFHFAPKNRIPRLKPTNLSTRLQKLLPRQFLYARIRGHQGVSAFTAGFSPSPR
jgi:hypothetical protein